MFFKNATLFRIAPALLQAITTPSEQEGEQDYELRAPTLEAALAECPLKPLGPLELSTFGFVAPLGDDSTLMTLTSGDNVLVTLAGESKIIPPASVNAILAKKLAEIEAKEGRRPGGRARKRLKEEVLQDLLPKALTKPSRTSAILNTKHGYIAVDTPSRGNAEAFVSALRVALGSFPALPLNAEVAPRVVLTSWVGGEELPEDWALGDEVELRDPVDGGAVVKCRNQELLCDEIAGHLETGKLVTKLALCLGDHINFTLDDSLTLRKIRLLDGAMDSLADTDADDLTAELTARFTLMASELEQAFLMLVPAFDLTPVEG